MKDRPSRQWVLVVDDSPPIVEFLCELLADEYATLRAGCGADAIELAITSQPDLILLDINMPGIDGYETCARLKADDRTRSIPIIFITANDDEADEAWGLAVGAIDYIAKPIRSSIVKARVRNQLELRRVEQQRESLIRELQEALANVHALRGLLPICAWCKRVRDDKGYWTMVETYIADHAPVVFSHGMCPGCYERVSKEQGLSGSDDK